MCEHFFFGVAHRHRLNFSDPLVAKELYKLVQQILNRGILPEPNRFLSSSHRAFILGIWTLLYHLLFFFFLILLLWLTILLYSISLIRLLLSKIRLRMLNHWLSEATRLLLIYHWYRPLMRRLILSWLLIQFALCFILKSEYPDFLPLQVLTLDGEANLFWESPCQSFRNIV